MSRALLPRGNTTPSRRSTLSLLESSKGPNCRFLWISSSAMALGMDLVCLSGCSIIRAKPKRAFLVDISLLRLSARSFAQRDQDAATGCWMLTADDAQRFPLANKDRTLSPLSVSPGWGEDRRG